MTVKRPKRSDTVWLQMRVRDQGPGIPPEHVAHLFDRFYRGAYGEPSNGKGQVDGLGLGLYICSAIVTAHGGTIAVESTVGVGTTFVVNLPLKTTVDATALTAREQ